MTNPPVGEPEKQWQQPAFDPANDPSNAPIEGTVYSASGQALAPVKRSAPPSVAETVVSTIAGLVWPVMIVLAIAGVVSWWPAILIALVSSVVAGNITGHLKARRAALTRGEAGEGQDLR